MRKMILAFGELLWDILPDQTILGGAVFNCAYRLQSLGNEVMFAGSIGEDELGKTARAQMEKLGMSTCLLQSNSAHPTGTVNVSLKSNGAPDFYIVPNVAYDFIEPTSDLLTAASAAECLCFGTLAQRAPCSRKTLHALVEAAPQAVKFLDINLRKNCFSEETVRWSLAAADILKLNDDEVAELTALLNLKLLSLTDFSDYIMNAYHLTCVVVTLGEKGAFAQSTSGGHAYVPGYRVVVTDTVGSGDAFSAAFIQSILHGQSLRSACELGNALGALVATTHGATAVIPQKEIDCILAQKTERLVHPEFS